MIDMPWRYTFGAFGASFFITWLGFAVIWYLIVWLHNDLHPDNLPGGVNQTDHGYVPCVWAIENFASCFLFSIETQHTIGYGSRATSEECPHAIIVMCLQSIIGVLSSSCMAGIVFAKLARPKYRTNTVIFSKNAVISMRDGVLYLLFRVGNIRKSHIIESHISGKLIHRKKAFSEGDELSYYSEDIKLSTSMELEDEDRCLMMFPTTMIHKIDEDSPFYSITPNNLLNADFEMVVVLEGIVEPTGNSFQARSSYLPREIVWGMRFDNMVYYSKGQYKIDISYLNALLPDDTPRKSMEEIDQLKSYAVTKAKNLSMSSSKSEISDNRGNSGNIISLTDSNGRKISGILSGNTSRLADAAAAQRRISMDLSLLGSVGGGDNKKSFNNRRISASAAANLSHWTGSKSRFLTVPVRSVSCTQVDEEDEDTEMDKKLYNNDSSSSHIEEDNHSTTTGPITIKHKNTITVNNSE